MLKRHIHALLDKYELKSAYSDLFSKKGLEWLRTPNLPDVDGTILNANLQRLQDLVMRSNLHENAISKQGKESISQKQLKIGHVASRLVRPAGPESLACSSRDSANFLNLMQNGGSGRIFMARNFGKSVKVIL
jgi:hypothetical protein